MSKKLIVLPGENFSLLRVIREISPYISPAGDQRRRVLCRCRCGKKIPVILRNLVSGNTKSCNCLRIKHGLTNHPLYDVYQNIMYSCYNENYPAFKYYGARGVGVCLLWKRQTNAQGLKNFVRWGEKNGWRRGLEISRRDATLDYSPANCCFLTPKRNHHYRERNKQWQTYSSNASKTLSAW